MHLLYLPEYGYLPDCVFAAHEPEYGHWLWMSISECMWVSLLCLYVSGHFVWRHIGTFSRSELASQLSRIFPEWWRWGMAAPERLNQSSRFPTVGSFSSSVRGWFSRSEQSDYVIMDVHPLKSHESDQLVAVLVDRHGMRPYCICHHVWSTFGSQCCLCTMCGNCE